MIGVIDYGMGNLGSVANALAFLGAPARVLKGPEEMADCLRDHPGGPKEAWLKHIWKEKGGKPA